jgi:uncharacterized protein (TIGR00369 family)
MSEPAASASAPETTDGPPWREPVRGGYLDPAGLLRPGRDQLRGLLEGRSPQPPISHLTGMRMTAVGDGTATFELPLSDWLCSSRGTISLGPLVIPADAAIACAILSQLPPEMGLTTAELSLRMLRSTGPGGTVSARARVIELGPTLSFAEASVSDGAGALVAHATSLCVLLPRPATSEAQTPVAQSARRSDPGALPDPWQRSAIGEPVPASAWDRLSGLELMREQLAGALPAPPIHHLTGLTLVSVGPGTATFRLPAGEWLCAPPPGRVQGGAVAVLAEAAITGAIQTTLPKGTRPGPIDLKVNYLRPLAANGGVAVATGAVVHAGRRLAVANAQVHDSDGKPVAVATGSAISSRAA